MKTQRNSRPKSIADISAGIDERASISAVSDQFGLAIFALISLGARVAASCAALERRVGALEEPGPRIDETGHTYAKVAIVRQKPAKRKR